MAQNRYISINNVVNEDSIYYNLKYYYGNYIFDGKTYSILEFIKNENEKQTFLFSHPDNVLGRECAIYFTLLTELLNNNKIVFIDIFKCDIGPGSGRKMLEAFLNYLLDRSVDKYADHIFTKDTNICLKPGEIVDSTRLTDEITFDKDKLIRYYNALGFMLKEETSQLCSTIEMLLYSIEREDNKRTGDSKKNYKKAYRSAFIVAKTFKPFKTDTKSKPKPKKGGRKKQMTRKKRK